MICFHSSIIYFLFIRKESYYYDYRTYQRRREYRQSLKEVKKESSKEPEQLKNYAPRKVYKKPSVVNREKNVESYLRSAITPKPRDLIR